MRIILLLTLIIGISSCKSQSISGNDLTGKWILVSESSSFPDNIQQLTDNDNGSESKSESDSKAKYKTSLTFNKDNKVFINQMGNEYNANYKLTDSTLTLGNRNYIIIMLDNKKLIYKEINRIFNKHYEFKKVK